MSYVERLKALVVKRGGSAEGIMTVSDGIKALEELEKPKYRPAPSKGLSDPE